MKRTITMFTCDICGHVSYGDGDAAENHKWAIVNRELNPRLDTCPEYLDLCSSCYSGLVKLYLLEEA